MNGYNELSHLDLVHLRAAWFMENMLVFTRAVAKYGQIGWSLDPDVKVPWIATHDIAHLAAKELIHPTGERRGIREVGSEDLTMPEVAAIISREIGRPVAYKFVDRKRKDIETGYLERGGTPERWIDDGQTLDAFNDGRVRFHGARPPLPTTMESFIRDTWKPCYLQSVADAHEPETFLTWGSGQ